MRRLSKVAGVVLVLLVASTAAAKGKKPKKANRAEERAIRASIASFTAAFHKGDAKALAALWAPDGDLVTASGQIIKGRSAIARQFELFLADRGKMKLASTVLSIRFLSPEVAIEDSTSEFIPPPVGPPTHNHFTTVYVKRDGKWLIASARASVSFPPSNYEHLQALEWMIGEWEYTDKSSGEHIHTTCRWSENKNFIIRQFRAELHGHPHRSGTTRIGWDPAQRRIRSWVFEDDGGIFEGQWTRDGKRWLVQVKGTLRDGTPAQAVNVLMPIDADTFQFQSVGRKLDGNAEPDVDPVQLTRKRGRR